MKDLVEGKDIDFGQQNADQAPRMSIVQEVT